MTNIKKWELKMIVGLLTHAVNSSYLLVSLRLVKYFIVQYEMSPRSFGIQVNPLNEPEGVIIGVIKYYAEGKVSFWFRAQK